MIKKFLNWYRSLSLTQQLFSIILSFVFLFLVFFLFFINRNINIYTQDQMYNRLRTSQDDLIYFYDSNQMSMENMVNRKSADIINYLFVINDDGTISTDVPSNDDINHEAYEELENNILLLSKIPNFEKRLMNKGIEGRLKNNNNFTYYMIRQINNNSYIVSILNNRYMTAFKDGLISNVIDMTVFVVCGFFIILMLWVSTIIHPLNQIKTYIEKIKCGKRARLNINRKDEIGEVANALLSMQKELEKQEKIKEEMIHNISHDLKTPIATIKSYGESIKDGIYPYDTLEKSVDVIINNAQRLEKKVKSLLQLNRIEYILSQQKEIRFCDMKDIVETVVLNTKVIRPEIEIETNLQTSLFNGNEEAWVVCIENILENALRYAKTQIVITLDDYQLCIYNDGEQIDKEHMRSLFKPYEKGKGGQFGLGLSIVYKVVNGNGYRLVVENVDGGGVIFMIKK